MDKIKKIRFTAVVFAFFFPMLLTWSYLILGEKTDPELQKGIYGIGKTIQFLLPVLCFWIFFRGTERQRPPVDSRRFWYALLEGTIFGLLVLGLILGLFFWLRHSALAGTAFEQLHTELSTRLTRMGVGTPTAFLLMGVFYCVLHSGLEEYYWRWFVYGQLRKVLSREVRTDRTVSLRLSEENGKEGEEESSATSEKPESNDESTGKNEVSRADRWALLLSAIGFTLHHIILLGTYFGFGSFICWFCSFGITVGGCYWAWIYSRSRTLTVPWLSHALIDLALFTVGYLILFQ